MLDNPKAALAGNAVQTMMANMVQRSLSTLFPGYFKGYKHNHYADFGFPEQINFEMLHQMYQRNSLAKGAIHKTVRKVWETRPALVQGTDVHDETETERLVRKRFEQLRVWQHMAEADRRGMVGDYAGVILRLADSKKFHEPVDQVSGGLNGLVEVIPAWEGQLRVQEWYDDETDENYGQPKMFQFDEAQVVSLEESGTGRKNRPRSFTVHPDRVVVISEDGTVHGNSKLRAGFNDLLTIEKVVGAGGEGFWKNAKQGLLMNADKDAQLEQMAQAMGTTIDKLAEAIDEQVEDFQKGFDKSIFTQGIKVEASQVTLPIPEHFFAVAVNCFAAGLEMPVKVLLGMQTGERASQEDADEWAKTCMGIRNDRVIPNIMALIDRLVQFRILPQAEWETKWDDLTEASMVEKIDRATKMADVNQKMGRGGLIVFQPKEIRETVGLDPKGATVEQFGDFEDGDEDQDDGNPPPRQSPEDEELDDA